MLKRTYLNEIYPFLFNINEISALILQMNAESVLILTAYFTFFQSILFFKISHMGDIIKVCLDDK